MSAYRHVAALLLALVLWGGGAQAEKADFSANFPGVFLSPGEDVIQTETSYRSENIALEITCMRVEKSDVYVADIYLRSLDCLTRAYAGGTWGATTSRMSAITGENGALMAITGDSAQNFSAGWVVGNGEIKRDTQNLRRDLCILYHSGEMVTLQAEEIDHEQIAAEAEMIWQTFLFGPVLLDSEGKALTDFSDSNVKNANPRSVIGYYKPGHYCFVQVDGRSTDSALQDGATNRGMTLTQLAALMESLGCTAAYNLDGGRSSMLWYGDQVISTPAAIDRRIGDIIMLKEPE